MAEEADKPAADVSGYLILGTNGCSFVKEGAEPLKCRWVRMFHFVCRLKVYKAFKEGQKRILVATDLVGRGIDIERVNIVINYDMPETDERHGNGADTYLHRVSPCFPRGAPLNVKR